MSDNIRVVYTPEGGSKRTWEFSVMNPPWDIAFGTEKATGWPWAEFAGRLMQRSAIAGRALLWVLRKREEGRLPLDAVEAVFGINFDVEDPDEDAGEPESAGGDEADEDPKA